jgi:Putative Flp pilus-assembly TadE/G-like
MLRGRGDPERGSVAVTVALTLTVLLGFAALVVDIGLNWATRTSAQTAADSAALAGASALQTDGGLAAITTVETYLNNNVPDLVELPDDAGWANDGNEANGEVVCWTMPNPVPLPIPGGVCPDEANALQVTTPPITVRYAFAPLLGKTTGSIKARAAAGAGPAAPNNCVLCVLEPDGVGALLVEGTGGIDVDGGGIVVNSDHNNALVLTSVGDVSANQIRVVGGVHDTGLGQLLPPAEEGGPPVPDPLAGLPTPDQLALPPTPAADPAPAISGAVTLTEGVYDSIDVPSGATLTLEAGVYVVTEPAGFRVGGRVEGDGVTIYLACADYPTPCDDEDGASFRLDPTGQFEVSPPATPHKYAGLSIFADRGNTASTRLFGNLDLTGDLAGALYTAGSRLEILSTGDVQIGSLVVVDRLRSINTAPFNVSYDPSLPLPGVGRPVLIG